MAKKMKLTLEQLIEILKIPIIEKRRIKFYYESKSGKKEWRTILPYMLIKIGENIHLVGIPIEELNKSLYDRQAGHYIITKLDLEKFEILSERFHDPGVPRDKVVNTQGKVICRFIYDDEDEKKVKSQWISIRDRKQKSLSE
jgi:hypothetical protein